jgi:hypothetical protein
MHKREGVYFNCFSPPVMLTTLTIESVLAVYTLWRYKMTELTRLITAMLLGLAAFQLAEYNVCTNYSHHPIGWSRFGFVMITALPPLGVHIMHVLADKPDRRIVVSAYVTMAAFMAFFLLSATAFTGHQCTGNYVIFQFSPKVTGAYSIYYYGWLLTGILLGARWADALMRQKGLAARRKLEAVRGLIVGYVVFLVPVAVVNTVRPSTRQGIPSIMCGFAVLLALDLALYILPRAATIKETPQKLNLTKA